MTLWWLQPGWAEARCACCGNQIWPEGDPDWGVCWPCKSEESARQEAEYNAYMQHLTAEEQQERDKPNEPE